MEKLGRLLRWLFGIQALLALVIPLRLFAAVRLYLKFRSAPPPWLHGHPSLLGPSLLIGTLYSVAILGTIGITCGIAWWALKKGWRSAQVWALIASVACLPGGHIFTIVGLAGLAVFWKKSVILDLADSARPPHAPGDGTHKYLEFVAPIAMYAVMIWAWTQWAHWGESQGLDDSQVPGLLIFLLADFAAMILHEAGHLLAGLSSDMVLRGFQLGPVAGHIRGGRWRLAFQAAGLLGGGSVAMVPTHLKNLRGRKLLMILGGPVASLLTGSIAIVMALGAHGSPWQGAWQFLGIFGTIGVLGFLFNLTPLRPEGAYSDGAQIYQIMRSGAWADRHLASAMVGSSLATSLRPRDYDVTILNRAADSTVHGLDGFHYRMFLAMHHLDAGRNEEGIAAWRQAVAQDPQATEKLSTDTVAELAFYEAAIANDLERARHWWHRVEAKGDSRKEVDYWKGRAAVRMSEGHFDEAAQAFHFAADFAQKLPEAGAYEFDRWCVELLRRKLNFTDLERLSRSAADPTATLQLPVPAIS